MIVGLILGRKGSQGFPGKNLYPVLGHPLAYYPMRAALDSSSIDKVYLSTDDERLAELAVSMGVEVIERPEHLCNNAALGEDAFRHGFEEIKGRNPGRAVEIAVLLFCNAATVSSSQIDEGIEILRGSKDLDSVVTVSKFNMWSPLRARKKTANGLLEPFVPFEIFGDPATLNCDRDSQGDVFYADMGVSVVKARCLEMMELGLLPQKWMGNKIYPLEQEVGLDVDYEWQIPIVEWWLKKYGKN